MKKKIGTILEEEVLRRAKRKAVEEWRPLSGVIQDALESYLSQARPEPAKRDAAYHLFCERPMRLSKKQLRAALEEDAWNP